MSHISTIRGTKGNSPLPLAARNGTADARMIRPVIFCHLPGPHSGFSNFALSPFRLEGKTWRTVEHYFQAHKFEDVNLQERVRRTKRPHDARRMGNDRRLKLRRDWESVKDQVMTDALWAKFTQIRELAGLLLSTDEAEIVEYSVHDSYWGNGGGKLGNNRLGQLLMSIRKGLRQYEG